ncbi:hypothetical protein LQ948_12765 [Jiella sp. MQZ9-1]|uniref:Uncharacterized protein n=1 Tax=Jiella flava TaxID=2816857 RepID=A0A939G0W4_9HYPH|nr:hypothetical protein [Jiella flava]MBO0663508.1 hypothetical protein [Jiella flava]MCD2472083.1 hypothetical protein [Jiella flava]
MAVVLAMGGKSAVAQDPVIDPAGPFRLGEGFADEPATCASLPAWIEKAPDYDGRISMTITGPLRESHWDGALAYLVMCDPKGVEVTCVTYAPHVIDPAKSVMLAGGYRHVGARRVILDPCLAYDE